MAPKRRFAVFLLPLLCLLLFSGCTDTVEKTPPPSAESSASAQPSSKTEGQSVTLQTQFRRQDGTALAGQSIRLSDGANRMEYSLDEEGQLQIAGIPKTGTYTLSVLEGNEEAGAITVHLTVGSVIDAATDTAGEGHVTLKADTAAVSLEFILEEAGTLSCALRLSAEEG